MAGQIGNAINDGAAVMQPQQNAPENLPKQTKDYDIKPQKGFKKFLRNSFNLTQMFMALPLLPNSLVLQAKNIGEQAKKVPDSGVTGYIANSIGTLASGFEYIIDKFVAGGRTVDDITTNRSATLFQNFFKRILHPNITKEFTSLLFNARRILFNIFPKTFTVPSAAHDPFDKGVNHAGATTAKFHGILATVTYPLTFLSSVFAGITTIPSHLLGSYYTYTGNNDAYQSTKYFNRISELFTPLMSNLSSLLSVSKSYIDSFLGDENNQHFSKFVMKGKYNVGFTNIVQGLLGSATSLPYFFGILAKLRDVAFEKDEKQEYQFSNNLKTLANNILPGINKAIPSFIPMLEKLNFVDSANIDDVLNNFKTKTEKVMHKADDVINNFLESIYNATPFTQNLFSKIRPKDGAGKLQGIADEHTIEAGDSQDYTFGFIKKSNFFKEIFDWLHPIQSMLMLLPNAFVPSADPYITDNALRMGRRTDRLFGFNSMILSLPNYFIYNMSTRVPQVMMKYFELQQRKYEDDLILNNGVTSIKSGYQHYQEMIEKLRRIPIVGMEFLANKLASLEIEEETFSDDREFRIVYEKLDADAREQEAIAKTSELGVSARIGFRTMLENQNKLFYAPRDPATGLTNDEQTRVGFYNSVSKFKSLVGKIPVVGWIASPFIEAFRSLYKVDTSKRRHVIGSNQNAVQAENQAAAETLAA